MVHPLAEANAELESLKAGLRNRLPLNADIGLRRAAFDRMAAGFPPLDAVTVAPFDGPIGGAWFEPRQVDPRVTILYVHGGGFTIGSPATYAGLMSRLADASGCRLFGLDYRLAPEHVFPAARDDTIAALTWLSASHGPVVIVGDSAGATLAVGAAQAMVRSGQPGPAGIVSISGYFDLENASPSILTRADRDPFLDARRFDVIRQAYLGGDLSHARAASPLHARWDGLPPLLLMVGTEEILFDDSLRAAERARAAGVAVAFEAWDEMIHVWPFFAPILAPGRDAIVRIAAFIRDLADRAGPVVTSRGG